MSVLNQRDIKYLAEIYKSFENDLRDAMPYFNEESLKILPRSVTKNLKLDVIEFDVDEEHKRITNQIINCLKKERFENLQELIVSAAWVRKFLG